jgi:hypothetical protein
MSLYVVTQLELWVLERRRAARLTPLTSSVMTESDDDSSAYISSDSGSDDDMSESSHACMIRRFMNIARRIVESQHRSTTTSTGYLQFRLEQYAVSHILHVKAVF